MSIEKKYILLVIGTVIVLFGVMAIDYVLFSGIPTEMLLMSNTFVEIIRIALIESTIITAIAWVISKIFFCEKEKKSEPHSSRE